MTELPELKDELHRKTFETLENLILSREKGKITNAEYQASINTMFSICSGLVDGDFFELITAAGKETVRDHSFVRTRVFKRKDLLNVVIRLSNKKKFAIVQHACRIVNSKTIEGDRDETDTNAETEERLAKFVEKMTASGFVEITK